MNITELDPREDEAWERFVVEDADATAFHTTAWCQVLTDTYEYSPRYFAMRGSDGEVVGAVPTMLVSSGLTGKRLVGLPFSDYCAPLGQGTDVLLDHVGNLVDDGLRYAEIRGQGSSSPSNYTGTGDLLLHEIDLSPDPDAIMGSFGSAARRGIKKAEREGVSVTESDDLEDMKAFFRLHTATRRKHGLVPQPWRFFENIHRHMVQTGSAHLLLAYVEGELAAGDLLLRHRQELVYKFNASDERYLDSRPNNALTWSAILLGKELGCRMLTLGRCERSNEGLLRFKRLWASRESDLPYFYYPRVRGATAEANGATLRYRAATTIFRYTPRQLLPAMGAAVYRHLG